MANRTPVSEWGRLFNFAGGGLVHMELFELFAMSADNPTLFEAISKFLLPFGTHAARPAAADAPLNAFYCETDTEEIYQNQDGTWVLVATVAGGGGGGVSSLAADAPILVDAATGAVTISHDDSGVTPGTYGDSGNVAVVTVDAQGHVTDVTEAAIAGGGSGLTLIENKIFTANATTYTFSGLDGDTDGTYRVIGQIKANSQARFYLRPNGVTSNLSRSGWRVLSSGNYAGDSDNTWATHLADVESGGILSFSYDIHARKSINSVAVRRSYNGTFLHNYFSGGSVDSGFNGGIWNETSTNMTSLEFMSTASNAIADGSQVALYKYAQ